MDMEVSDILKKRRISLVLESGERLFEQSFSSRKKGQGSVCSDILETIEQIYPLRILQNGKFALPKIRSATRRLYVQTPLKERILFNSAVLKLYYKMIQIQWSGYLYTNVFACVLS